MAPPIPCRYYALGHCSNGTKCPYLHSDDQSKRVCQFYLKGNCSFGTKCQLEHTKPKKTEISKFKSASQSASFSSSSSSAASRPTPVAYSQVRVGNKMVARDEEGDLSLLCKFSKEECKFGDRCRSLHGLVCPVCLLPVLHPKQEKTDHEKHIYECKMFKDAEDRSASMECAVCLETIRKNGKGSFGLLACRHCVCYTCITQWRENDTQKMANSKTCPVCRTVTRFIVPSTVWPCSDEEKEEITRQYKDKLSKIDCRSYNFGKGTCPFGTSCFYKHCDENGVLEAKNRFLEGDGVKIMKAVQLLDYLHLDDKKKEGGGS